MRQIRDSAEQAFANLGRIVYRHRYLTVALTFGLVALLLLKLPTLTIDTSNDAFYHADDPIRIQYNEFQRQFGKDDRIVVAIESQTIFDTGVLRQIRALQETIDREVPHLKNSTSILNARYTAGIDDELIVEDFIEVIPETRQQLDELEQKAKKMPTTAIT